MTCIVGFSDKEGVSIGGDSAGIAGYDISVRSDEKVFKNGPFIMGFTTSFRMGNLLRYSLVIPERRGENIIAFMNTKFIESVRQCLFAGGYTPHTEGGRCGGTFLVAYEGILFVIYDDFQVAVPKDKYASVGCGASYALGALHSIQNSKLSTEERVKIALDAASYHSAGVCKPYTVVSQYNVRDF